MNKKGIILIFVGCILILTSFSFVFYNDYQNKKAGTESKKVYNIIENEIIKIDNTNKEMKTINIDGNDYLGTINIPSLDLNLPIMSDWDYNKMKISPCIYYGSIFTNDLVLCAHSYDNLFGRIKNLNANDILILTDIDNNKYYYEVKEIEILSPKEVKRMIESEFDLTLYTCTSDALNRVTVRLNRVY